MSTATPTCPCCGQLAAALPLRWHADSKTLLGPAGALTLSKSEAIIFSLLWDARDTGRWITRAKMMHELYAFDPHGGAESDNIISVFLARLRRRLTLFGLGITTGYGSGYRLVVERVERVEK